MNWASRVLSFVMLLGGIVSNLPPAARDASCLAAKPAPAPAAKSCCEGMAEGRECCCGKSEAAATATKQVAAKPTGKKECQCLTSGSTPSTERATPGAERPQVQDWALVTEPGSIQIPPVAEVRQDHVHDSPRIRGPDPSDGHLRAPPVR